MDAVYRGLMLLPMAISSLASSLSDPRAEKGLWRHVRMSWMIIGGLIVVSMALFREGGICVIMAAPFFGVFSAVGSADAFADPPFPHATLHNAGDRTAIDVLSV